MKKYGYYRPLNCSGVNEKRLCDAQKKGQLIFVLPPKKTCFGVDDLYDLVTLLLKMLKIVKNYRRFLIGYILTECQKSKVKKIRSDSSRNPVIARVRGTRFPRIFCGF